MRRRTVFAASFAVLLALLVVRNHALFSVAVDETGDSAANSILVHQAKEFRLLVGNYSRLGFSHPGPAFLYVQAFGEWLFHDVLHVVPTWWNGQALAALALNAALLACTLTVLAGWYPSWPRLALAGAVLLAYATVYSGLFSTVWMPLMYVAPFLLLLVSASSVVAGRTGDLWAVGLSGGLLVHGHAEFLLFVPVIAGIGVVAALRRRAPRAHWLAFGAVLVPFALTIGLDLALHWPGEFGRYLGYGGSSRAPGHGPGAALAYTLRFWPGRSPWLAAPAALALFGAAWLLRRRPLVRAGFVVGLVVTLLFVGYAVRGIDDLSQDYVGYFLRAVPLFLILLLVLTVVPPWRAVAGGALAVAVLAALAVPAALLTPREQYDSLPAVLATLRARAGGRPVVVDLDPDVWPALDALVIGGQRRGIRVCAGSPQWTFMVTREFVCTPSERAVGYPVRLGDGAEPDGGVLARLGSTVVSTRT